MRENNKACEGFLDVIDAATAICGADCGDFQLVDPEDHKLRIAAQRGLPEAWINHWSAASLQAFQCGERVIVEDVEDSPIFVGTPELQIHRQANVRSVASTPIFGRDGAVLGVFSAYFRSPHHPDARELRLLDLLARRVADGIERDQVEMALRKSEALRRLALQGANGPRGNGTSRRTS